MEILKFTLKGKFAFFKKPDLNSYIYFTYGNIHKIALLGIFGAILGYGGYNSMSFKEKYHKQFGDKIKCNNQVYPEFYEKLRKLNVAIVPYKASFDKKVQSFNNSVGYASQEAGGNLVVREQWLENPCWDIYVSLDCEEAVRLKQALTEGQYVYIPYLGKNDHMADICSVEVIRDIKKVYECDTVHSLYEKNDFSIVMKKSLDFLDDDDEDDQEDEIMFKYEERLPIALQENTNGYMYNDFAFTNYHVKMQGDKSVYSVGDKNIVFI